MKRGNLLRLFALSAVLTACDSDPEPQQYGPIRSFRRRSAGFPHHDDCRPGGMGRPATHGSARLHDHCHCHRSRIPCRTLVLPNGDILVAQKAEAEGHRG